MPIIDVNKASDLILSATPAGEQRITVRPYRIKGELPPGPSLDPDLLDDPENWQRAIEYENALSLAPVERNPLKHAGQTFVVRTPAQFIELLEYLAKVGHRFPLDAYVEWAQDIETGRSV